MTTAVLICAGLLLAWFAGYSWLTAAARTAPCRSRHAHAPASPDEPPGQDGPPWWDQAPPEPTGVIPHAVGTWGGTPQQLAGELAARHLDVTP